VVHLLRAGRKLARPNKKAWVSALAGMSGY